MTPCIDTEKLVTLGTALGWEDLDLSHLIECGSCQGRLDELRALRNVLDLELAPRPQFVDEVVQTLTVREASARPKLASLRVWDVVNPALAGITALFAIGFVAGGDMAMQLGPALFIGPIIAAAVTLWWNRTHDSGITGVHS